MRSNSKNRKRSSFGNTKNTLPSVHTLTSVCHTSTTAYWNTDVIFLEIIVKQRNSCIYKSNLVNAQIVPTQVQCMRRPEPKFAKPRPLQMMNKNSWKLIQSSFFWASSPLHIHDQSSSTFIFRIERKTPKKPKFPTPDNILLHFH